MATRNRRTRASREAMSQFPDAYLLCRDRAIGHDWDIDSPFELTPRITGGYDLTRSCRCVRCTTTRIEYFDHVGKGGYITKIRQRYTYPDGYSITGIGEVDSSAVWTEQARRANVEAPAKRAAKKVARKRPAKEVS